MNESEIYAGLNDIFRNVFDDDTIVLRPEMNAGSLKGWDSLKMISIVIAVEKRFEIKMRTREIDRLVCVGDFVELIQNKRGS